LDRHLLLKSLLSISLPITFLFVSSLANAKSSAYSDCIQDIDPPKCLIRISAKSRRTTDSELFEAVIKSGAVGLTQTKSKALVFGARAAVSSTDAIFKQLGIVLPRDVVQKTILKSEREIILAAVALAAAAQNSADPFSDPIVKELVEKSENSSAIPILAAKFWLEIDTYGVWATEPTRPPGLHKIWEKIIADRALDEAILVELASSGGFTNQAKDLALPLYGRFEALQHSSNESKATMASALARFYGLPDRAEQLMYLGGKKAQNYEINGVYAEIATAKLNNGYDKKSAERLLGHSLEDTDINDSYTFYVGIKAREALQAAHANDELIQLAKSYLERANETKRKSEERANLYALSSDCYLRSGDKDNAQNVARLGLKIVPDAVLHRLSEEDRKISAGKPQEQARLAQGFGTYPAVALYRSSAVPEALSSGYLTGFDRYNNAEFVGETPDPKWVIKYNWPIAFSFMVHHALNTSDENIRKSVYKEMMTWVSGNPELQSSYEVQEQLAVLAAATGDRSAMLNHLVNYAKALDNDSKEGAAYFSLALAEQWLRDSRIIRKTMK
jgi:hypothetical protein